MDVLKKTYLKNFENKTPFFCHQHVVMLCGDFNVDVILRPVFKTGSALNFKSLFGESHLV